MVPSMYMIQSRQDIVGDILIDTVFVHMSDTKVTSFYPHSESTLPPGLSTLLLDSQK